MKKSEKEIDSYIRRAFGASTGLASLDQYDIFWYTLMAPFPIFSLIFHYFCAHIFQNRRKIPQISPSLRIYSVILRQKWQTLLKNYNRVQFSRSLKKSNNLISNRPMQHLCLTAVTSTPTQVKTILYYCLSFSSQLALLRTKLMTPIRIQHSTQYSYWAPPLKVVLPSNFSSHPEDFGTQPHERKKGALKIIPSAFYLTPVLTTLYPTYSYIITQFSPREPLSVCSQCPTFSDQP